MRWRKLAVKGVLVDLDGTMIKFKLDFMAARRAFLKELERRRLRTPDLTEELSVYLMLKGLRPRLSESEYGELRKIAFSIVEEIEVKAAREAELIAGAVEAIKRVKGLGLKVALATNNSAKGIRQVFQKFGLEGLFDAVVTRDDCEYLKPDPEPLLRAMERIRLSKEEAMCVGDTVFDIRAAKAAGILCVAVPTGASRLAKLLEEGPDYLISSIAELPELLVRELLVARG